MFQLVQSGNDPNTGNPIFDLRGLNREPLQCLIRALQREAKDGDRYVAEDLLKAIQEPEAWGKIKAKYDSGMTPQQGQRVRELYARVLAAGDGCETTAIWAARDIASREPMDVILQQLDGHADLAKILGE